MPVRNYIWFVLFFLKTFWNIYMKALFCIKFHLNLFLYRINFLIFWKFKFFYFKLEILKYQIKKNLFFKCSKILKIMKFF